MQEETLFVNINFNQVKFVEITDKAIYIHWIDGTMTSAEFDDELNKNRAHQFALKYCDANSTFFEKISKQTSQE